MLVGVVHMFAKRASEKNVKDLHSAANAENRKFSLNEFCNQILFGYVAFAVHAICMRVCRTVKTGGNVAAARQQQSVATVGFCYIGRNNAFGSAFANGARVVFIFIV